MPDEPPSFDIACLDDQWTTIQNSEKWHSDFYKILVKLTEMHKGKELSVCLTNDAHMQELNRDYRNKNKPTNVLAFPSIVQGHLGDIVLSYETIKEEALSENKDFIKHAWHLFLHGFLHLLGYDHENIEDEKIMQEKEIEILEQMGVKNPYLNHK